MTRPGIEPATSRSQSGRSTTEPLCRYRKWRSTNDMRHGIAFTKCSGPFNRNDYTFMGVGWGWWWWGGSPIKIIFASLLKKRVYSKWKEFAPVGGSKFFPFRVDPFLNGHGVQGKQIGSHESCLSYKNCENIYRVCQVPLNLRIREHMMRRTCKTGKHSDWTELMAC